MRRRSRSVFFIKQTIDISISVERWVTSKVTRHLLRMRTCPWQCTVTKSDVVQHKYKDKSRVSSWMGLSARLLVFNVKNYSRTKLCYPAFRLREKFLTLMPIRSKSIIFFELRQLHLATRWLYFNLIILTDSIYAAIVQPTRRQLMKTPSFC